MLSVSPLIIHAFTSIGFPLGAASALGPMVKRRRAHFLVMPSGTLEEPGSAEWLAIVGRAYLADHPRHELTFVCNTTEQADTLRAAGGVAETINQNCFMDDQVFKPLPNVEPIYDAVYNARLSPEKRHELAANIESLALIYFYDVSVGPPASFHALHARYVAMLPNARFINQLTPEGCQWLMGDEINRILAQSRVGLCLSRAEGAMRAAIEYLFAGLPVVATTSAGGRDYFFDDEFCVTVNPDPRSVREAKDALIARGLPRDYIRTKTLAKVEVERRRYISFVQDLIDRGGGADRFEDLFWKLARGQSIVNWQSMEVFYASMSRQLEEVDAAAAGRAGCRP